MNTGDEITRRLELIKGEDFRERTDELIRQLVLESLEIEEKLKILNICKNMDIDPLRS